jgi:hypothetical protein
VAGETPHAAVQNFIHSIQQALHSVTNAVIRPDRSGGFRVGARYSTILPSAEGIRLRKLDAEDSLGLKVDFQFDILREERTAQRPYRVQVRQYVYTLWDWQADRRMLAFHWHPDQTPDRRLPHLHLYTASGVVPALEGRHIPSGHIPLESVLRFLIEEMNVRHSAN